MHGGPAGLSEVTVITTVLPISPATGVYVNENGEVDAEEGFTDPDPFSVIATFVAVPPKVFPETVTGAVPQMLPLVELSIIAGGLIHPHETLKMPPTVVHPSVFLTDRKWLPFATSVKTGLA